MGYVGDKKREYQRRWIAARRQAWIDENGPCSTCGSVVSLEVDHVNPEDKRLNPTHLWSLSPSNPARIEELAKCQVLCATCHLTKSTNEKLATDHGVAMYGRGCRCEICRESQKSRVRDYRARLQAA